MPVVFDEVSADIAPPPQGDDRAPDHRSDRAADASLRIEDPVRHALEAEQRRRQRLSDR